MILVWREYEMVYRWGGRAICIRIFVGVRRRGIGCSNAEAAVVLLVVPVVATVDGMPLVKGVGVSIAGRGRLLKCWHGMRSMSIQSWGPHVCMSLTVYVITFDREEKANAAYVCRIRGVSRSRRAFAEE